MQEVTEDQKHTSEYWSGMQDLLSGFLGVLEICLNLSMEHPHLSV